MSESEQIYKAFLHAEVIGQARLNNFLMTGTIVLVGCAVSLQIQNQVIGPMVSIVLSTLGISFSRMWYYLGLRQRLYHHFLEEHMDLAKVEAPEDPASQTIKRLREFHTDLIPFCKDKNDNFLPEDKFTSRKFLTTVPRYFIVAYTVIWIASACSFLFHLFQTKHTVWFWISLFVFLCFLLFLAKTLSPEVKILCQEKSATDIKGVLTKYFEETREKDNT